MCFASLKPRLCHTFLTYTSLIQSELLKSLDYPGLSNPLPTAICPLEIPWVPDPATARNAAPGKCALTVYLYQVGTVAFYGILHVHSHSLCHWAIGGASVKLDGILSKRISYNLGYCQNKSEYAWWIRPESAHRHCKEWQCVQNEARKFDTWCYVYCCAYCYVYCYICVAHAERTGLLQHPAWCIGICRSCLVNSGNSGTRLPGVFLKFHTFHASSFTFHISASPVGFTSTTSGHVHLDPFDPFGSIWSFEMRK